MKVKYLILLAILSLGMAACGDDEEEEMNPTPVMCETEGVTYNNDIASIITTNCTTAVLLLYTPNYRTTVLELSARIRTIIALFTAC